MLVSQEKGSNRQIQENYTGQQEKQTKKGKGDYRIAGCLPPCDHGQGAQSSDKACQSSILVLAEGT